MKGMILAAGFGTRLLPLTLCRAKAAIPYRNRPLICHCLEALAAAGVQDVEINLHHLPDSVRRAVAAAAVPIHRIHYSHEPEILGTAGALNPVRPRLGSDPFLLVNGKIVFDFDLGPAMRRHRESDALATLVLVDRSPGEDFNPVFVGSDGNVCGFARSAEERALPGLVFTGIHLLGPKVWKYVPPAGFCDMVRDVYIPALKAGELLGAYHAPGRWLEFSTLQRYLRLNVDSGRNWVGAGSRVSPAASISNSVLWDDVHIAAGCSLENCVVADGVELPAGTILRNTAVVPASLAPPEFGRFVRDGLVCYPLEGTVESGH